MGHICLKAGAIKFMLQVAVLVFACGSAVRVEAEYGVSPPGASRLSASLESVMSPYSAEAKQ